MVPGVSPFAPVRVSLMSSPTGDGPLSAITARVLGVVRSGILTARPLREGLVVADPHDGCPRPLAFVVADRGRSIVVQAQVAPLPRASAASAMLFEPAPTPRVKTNAGW